jgi:hypothetical protein
MGKPQLENCQLGKDHTDQQKNSINQVAVQAASATFLNLEWQALMANMAHNLAGN